MVDVTESVEPAYTERAGQVGHRAQDLGGVPASPRITGEHIAGRRQLTRLERQPGAPNQYLVIAGVHHIGTASPSAPFGVTEFQEYARVGKRRMTRPGQVLRHQRVGRVSLEDRSNVRGNGTTENEA